MSKIYKKFIILFFFFCSFLCIFYFILIYLLIYFGNANTSLVHYYKTFLLKEIDKNERIIIDSGSNSHHGIFAEMLEEYFKIPSINIADVGAIPLHAKLARLEKFVKKGDILIMPLEYEYYSTENMKNNFFLDNIFFEFSWYFDFLSYKDKIALVFNIPFSSLISYTSKIKSLIKNDLFDTNMHKNNIKFLNQFYNSKIDINKITDSELKDAFSNFKINKFGDYTYKGEVIVSDIAKEWINNCQKSIFKGNINKKAVKLLDNFFENMKKRGVVVILTYPVVVGDNCYNFNTKTGLNFKFFLEDLKTKFSDTIFIGNWQDSYFEKKYLLDTPYHVNQEAQIINTKRLIKLIEPYIKRK